MTENVIIDVHVSDQSSERVTHCDVNIHGASGTETKEANYLGIAVGFTLEKGKTYTATVVPPTGYTSVSGSTVSFVASQSGIIYCSLNKTTTAPYVPHVDEPDVDEPDTGEPDDIIPPGDDIPTGNGHAPKSQVATDLSAIFGDIKPIYIIAAIIALILLG